MKYYWVYIPDVDEAGCVVHADGFEAAFKRGVEMLFPDDGLEVQVHELGESQSFVAGETTAEDQLRSEREQLRLVLDASGGRGVDVAERIDQIDKELGESEHLKRFRVSGTFRRDFVVEVDAESVDDACDLAGQFSLNDFDATSYVETSIDECLELDAGGAEFE